MTTILTLSKTSARNLIDRLDLLHRTEEQALVLRALKQLGAINPNVANISLLNVASVVALMWYLDVDHAMWS